MFQVIETVPDGALDDGVGPEGGDLQFRQVQGVISEGAAEGFQQRLANPGDGPTEDDQVGVQQGADRGQAHREPPGQAG